MDTALASLSSRILTRGRGSLQIQSTDDLAMELCGPGALRGYPHLSMVQHLYFGHSCIVRDGSAVRMQPSSFVTLPKMDSSMPKFVAAHEENTSASSYRSASLDRRVWWQHGKV